MKTLSRTRSTRGTEEEEKKRGKDLLGKMGGRYFMEDVMVPTCRVHYLILIRSVGFEHRGVKGKEKKNRRNFKMNPDSRINDFSLSVTLT